MKGLVQVLNESLVTNRFKNKTKFGKTENGRKHNTNKTAKEKADEKRHKNKARNENDLKHVVQKSKEVIKKAGEKTKEVVVTTTHKVGELHDFVTQDIPTSHH